MQFVHPIMDTACASLPQSELINKTCKLKTQSGPSHEIYTIILPLYNLYLQASAPLNPLLWLSSPCRISWGSPAIGMSDYVCIMLSKHRPDPNNNSVSHTLAFPTIKRWYAITDTLITKPNFVFITHRVLTCVMETLLTPPGDLWKRHFWCPLVICDGKHLTSMLHSEVPAKIQPSKLASISIIIYNLGEFCTCISV